MTESQKSNIFTAFTFVNSKSSADERNLETLVPTAYPLIKRSQVQHDFVIFLQIALKVMDSGEPFKFPIY